MRSIQLVLTRVPILSYPVLLFTRSSCWYHMYIYLVRDIMVCITYQVHHYQYVARERVRRRSSSQPVRSSYFFVGTDRRLYNYTGPQTRLLNVPLSSACCLIGESPQSPSEKVEMAVTFFWPSIHFQSFDDFAFERCMFKFATTLYDTYQPLIV